MRLSSVVATLCIMLVGLLTPSLTAFAAPWNDDRTDDTCYKILIPETRKYPQFTKYTPLTLENFYQNEVYGPVSDAAKNPVGLDKKVSREQASAIVSRNARDMAFGINFTDNKIAVLDFKMGEVFGPQHDLLLRDAFPYFAAARTLPTDEVYDNYRVMLYYFADSLDFLYCSALLQPIVKPNLEPKDITAERIGMMLPPHPFEVKTVEMDGKKFKIMDVQFDMLDRTDGQKLIESHWIAVMPESASQRYNPYNLVDTYKKTIDYFYNSGKFDPTNENAIRSFDPIKNYAIAQAMLLQKQEFAWNQAWLVGDENQMLSALNKSNPNDQKFLAMTKVPLTTQTAYFAQVADRVGEKESTVFGPLDKIRTAHGITTELTDAYIADGKKYIQNPAGFDVAALNTQPKKTTGSPTLLLIAGGAIVIFILFGSLFSHRRKK